MYRTEIHDTITSALRQIPEILHIGLWNENIQFINQEQPWPRPAVFIEFLPADWTAPSKEPGILTAEPQIRLHIVTDAITATIDSRAALSADITAALSSTHGQYFTRMRLSQTATSHNHDEIIEDIDTYTTKAYKTIRQTI